MPLRTFIRLLILLVILVGVAVYLNRPTAEPGRIGGIASGDVLFAGLDVNAVEAIQIDGPDSSVRVVRGGEGWYVEQMHGYPAHFPVVARFLRKLNDLKAGQVLRDGEAALDELGLNPASGSPDYLAVTLEQEGGPPVSFALGVYKRARAPGGFGMGNPQGRFLRIGSGPVVLTDELFVELAPRPLEWIDRELLQIAADDVASVSVRTETGAYTLRRDEQGGYLLDIIGENETVETAAALRLFQGLQWLRMDGVYDPELSDEDIGLSSAGLATYTLTSGMAYDMEVGGGADMLTMRPVRIRVSDTSPEQVNAEEAGEINRRFARWRYQVPAMTAGALIPGPSSLVTVIPTEAAPEAASGAFEVMTGDPADEAHD